MADPGDLPAVAAEVSADLTACGILHAVSGSIAMAIHARPRATMDVDFLVVAPAVRWPEVFGIIRRRGFLGDDRECIQAIRERGFASLRSGPVSVDVLVPQIPYHREVARRAVPMRLLGQDVPVVTPEDLFVLKALWWRLKDRLDLETLADALRGRLDVAYVQRTLASLLPGGDPRLEEVARLLTPSAPR